MERNNGLQVDPLFVAVTRPAMRMGVTSEGMVIGAMLVFEMFLMTKNLLWLLAYIPIHGLLALLLLGEPRFFELLRLWARTKGVSLIKGGFRHWKASSYSPLRIGVAGKNGRRKLPPCFSNQ